MYLCVCAAAVLLSDNTHEQPRQSPDPACGHAAVLLRAGSRLWCYWLHPWDAHLGFHGSRGETAFMWCCFCSAFQSSAGAVWHFLARGGFSFCFPKEAAPYEPLSSVRIVASCAFFLCSEFKPTNTLCLKKEVRLICEMTLKWDGSAWKNNGRVSWALQDGLVEMAVRERDRVYTQCARSPFPWGCFLFHFSLKGSQLISFP